MLNSTTWLYGAEVLPIALRSKIMGLAAASHFIVNVGSKFWPLVDSTVTTFSDNTSHPGRSQRLRQHQGELLLRFRYL